MELLRAPRRRRRCGAPTAASLLLVLLTAAGCERPPPPEAPPSPWPPQRIVTVAPSLTEIVFALGLGDRVVGVGDYSEWPPEVFSKPRIGGLFDVRLEKIVELQPDLAILLPSEERLARQMRELGVEVLTVEHETLRDVEEAMLAVARRAGVSEAGEELAERFREQLAADPLAAAPTVLLTLTREEGELGNVLVAGPDTFYAELLDRLGVTNAFESAGISYPQVGAEEIVRRAPHAIVELQPDVLSRRAQRELLDDWRQLPGLPAATLGCLRVITGDHTLLPGPRAPRLYREIREALLSCPEIGGAEREAAS